MPPPIVEFVGWILARVVNTPEPLALLVLGSVLLIASFRSRRDRRSQPAKPTPSVVARARRRSSGPAAPPLVTQQGHS